MPSRAPCDVSWQTARSYGARGRELPANCPPRVRREAPADLVVAVLDEHVESTADDVRSVWSSDDGLTLERVLAADAWARQRARQVVTAIAEREHTR